MIKNFRLLFIFSIFFSFNAFSFVPKANTIIQKWIENNGTGNYTIEIEVAFPSAPEAIIIREIWTIENDHTMKMVATGLGGKLKWVFHYKNGHRLNIQAGFKDSRPIGEEFIEKYFHFRKPEQLTEVLVSLKAAHADLFKVVPFKAGKDPDFQSDPWLKLARVGGSVSYVFGNNDQQFENNSFFFIEQDQFVLKKFRLPNVEVFANNYNLFSRGLMFPRNRVVKWGNQKIILNTIQVSTKFDKKSFSVLEPSSTSDFIDFGTAKPVIEEFYKRFR